MVYSRKSGIVCARRSRKSQLATGSANVTALPYRSSLRVFRTLLELERLGLLCCPPMYSLCGTWPRARAQGSMSIRSVFPSGQLASSTLKSFRCIETDFCSSLRSIPPQLTGFLAFRKFLGLLLSGSALYRPDHMTHPATGI